MLATASEHAIVGLARQILLKRLLADCRSVCSQAVKARANYRLNPAQAKRRREELARVPELLLSLTYCLLIPSVLLGPCAVIWITNADPLQAAPLTFAVRCDTHLQICI